MRGKLRRGGDPPGTLRRAAGECAAACTMGQLPRAIAKAIEDVSREFLQRDSARVAESFASRAASSPPHSPPGELGGCSASCARSPQCCGASRGPCPAPHRGGGGRLRQRARSRDGAAERGRHDDAADVDEHRAPRAAGDARGRRRVLDFMTGTGVVAGLAGRRGAEEVVAIDASATCRSSHPELAASFKPRRGHVRLGGQGAIVDRRDAAVCR